MAKYTWAEFARSRMMLIVLGVILGLAARVALGPPLSETQDVRRFSEPLTAEALND